MKITVNLKNNNYDIILERGCINKLGTLIDTNRKTLVITDDNIPPKWSEIVCSQLQNVKLVKVPHGEKA